MKTAEYTVTLEAVEVKAAVVIWPAFGQGLLKALEWEDEDPNHLRNE
jgi:hypothetical protein